MGAFFQELLNVGIYKRSQGRITRQVTFAALAVGIGIGLWRMNIMLHASAWAGAAGGIEYWLPGLLLLLTVWITYRLVNYPAFADFLIAVEAEMNKVSWPSRTELIRASIVVLVMLVLLAVVLFLFDTFWQVVFRKLLHIL